MRSERGGKAPSQPWLMSMGSSELLLTAQTVTWFERLNTLCCVSTDI